MRNYYPILFFVLGLIACQSSSSSEWKPLNLLQYNIPITILAPDSAKVVNSTLGVIQDVTVKSQEDNYSIQIFASEATTTSLPAIKTSQLLDIRNNPFFSKIVMEEEPGFIYENQLDSNLINYGFRYIRVQGDKEYVFQTGLVGQFSLEEVKRMYEAVKQK